MSNTNNESAVPYQPTARDMVLLERPVDVKISPDGSKVAIKVSVTNWKENCYEHDCHVYDRVAGTTRQISRYGDVKQMAWLDNQTLALLRADQDSGKAQLWVYEDLVGDGWPATDHKGGVNWFEPFAAGLLYLATDHKRAEKKERAGRFGEYTHFEREESSTALYYVDLDKLREYRRQEKTCTEEEAQKLVLPVIELSQLLEEPLAIQSVCASPAGDAVYLNCWKHDDLIYWRETSAFQISLDPHTAVAGHIERQQEKSAAKDLGDEKDEKEKDLSYLGEITPLYLPRAANIEAVSPDGRRLLITYQGRDDKMYTIQDRWTIATAKAIKAGTPEEFLLFMSNISAALDRQLLGSFWIKSGIFGTYVNSTTTRIAHFSEDGRVTPVDLGSLFVDDNFHVSDENTIAFVGSSNTTFPEVYLAAEPDEDGKRLIKQLTAFGRAVEAWDLGTVEVIRWRSKDGTEIEGILRKPSSFDPQRRYPLVFVVHGGPRWFSEESLVAYDEFAYYPSIQFVNKDILVLKPNYRGSLGRGQAFTDLNVNNLGTGDLWDLESAIDHLLELGYIDPEHIGCMGWSQGGYISAFAGLHSEKFSAVSVGAGVSDWYTYHIGNDIPDFTVDYLSASPFRDREPYEKSAPMTNITNARTPMLIQHGSDDRRVPLSNATELYRALKEMDVPVELFIFPGMAHPITKPRENHAVMHQNLAWFSHYLLGEDLQMS